MKKRYQRNRSHAYLILEEDKIYKEEYQLRMILENEIKGLLKMQGRGIEGKSCFFYDIAGKESLKKYYKKKTISKEEIMQFLKSLQRVMDNLYEHMLDVSSLILKPEYIFWQEGEIYFCFCPYEKCNIHKDFHGFTEFLVSQIDYEDRESIWLAYELHKRTMKSGYDLNQLIEEMLSKAQEKNQPEEEEKWEQQKVCEEVVFDSYLPTTKKKRKRGKWGNWDAFMMEKERN